MSETGIKLVQIAVTDAATLLARLKRQHTLDDRDRQACALFQAALEAAEKVLYGENPSPPLPPAPPA